MEYVFKRARACIRYVTRILLIGTGAKNCKTRARHPFALRFPPADLWNVALNTASDRSRWTRERSENENGWRRNRFSTRRSLAHRASCTRRVSKSGSISDPNASLSLHVRVQHEIIDAPRIARVTADDVRWKIVHARPSRKSRQRTNSEIIMIMDRNTLRETNGRIHFVPEIEFGANEIPLLSIIDTL